ncbi:hypothetical protein [Streptomyces marincola]|uniref:Uncharacterized protein n=1 Tax=Streptomyces marincola TaxID=2878388 RepID=A0A1W7CT09_9ACTN|nr:hypothetical protein [Streptomyces marincola]ARQ67885.1 hypothetical protein CAG99_02680 [Streptomyces marincola]
MPDELPISSAADEFERLLGEESPGAALTLAPVLDAFARFAGVAFDVPDAPDADGCVLTHGVTEGLEGKTFTVRVSRGLRSPGGTEPDHVRVFCELGYEAAEPYDELGSRAESWFRGSDPEDFATWWRAVTGPLRASGLDDASPSSVEIGADDGSAPAG